MAFSAILLSFACGGSGSANTPTTAQPLPASLEYAFDNGADFVVDPDVLSGRWRQDWSAELDTRVTEADYIAEVTIPTIRRDVTPGGEETVRVIDEEDRRILGTRGELSLRSKETDPGYASVNPNTDRLQETRMVLFVKWADEDGEVVARWHLSPASEAVVSRVDYLAERRRGVERESTPGRVFVHTRD